MNCPVCKIELKFSVQNLDEAYYDCSNCDSSLLFKNGKCEVLSEGNFKKSETQKNPSEENITEQESVQKKTGSTRTSFKESALQNTLTEENTDQQKLEKDTEAFQNGENQEFLEPAKEKTLNENFDEQNSPPPPEEENPEEEEEFFPDETTQVPELNIPEENSSDSSSEQKEEQEKEHFEKEDQESSTDLEKEEARIDNSIPEEDFPFEEGTQETPSELQKEDVSQKKEDFSEVAEFGNTQNQDRKGPFLYDLILSEINSQSLREQILSTLDDESLNLSLSEENIKNGKLTILKISPVQAFIIVTALMGLPLRISWRQNHIADV